MDGIGIDILQSEPLEVGQLGKVFSGLRATGEQLKKGVDLDIGGGDAQKPGKFSLNTSAATFSDVR